MSEVFYIKEGTFTKEQIAKEKSPLKAIRNYCRYSCCCNDLESQKECNNTSCFLHAFRFGKNSNSKRTLTDEQKAKLAERLKKSLNP